MAASACTVAKICLASFAVLGAGLAACDDDEFHFRYRAHSDKITRGAGDAAASNIATHTIDPWPPVARRTRINQNGKRAYIAVKRYETNTSIPPKGINSTNGYNGNNGTAPGPLPPIRN
jgi:hypothetical protein